MEYISIVLSVLSVLGILLLFFRKSTSNISNLEDIFRAQLQKEFLLNREELSKNLKENRNELTQSIERLNETLIKKAKDDREELRLPNCSVQLQCRHQHPLRRLVFSLSQQV